MPAQAERWCQSQHLLCVLYNHIHSYTTTYRAATILHGNVILTDAVTLAVTVTDGQ